MLWILQVFKFITLITLKCKVVRRCTSPFDGAGAGWYADVPVHLVVQEQGGTLTISKHFSSNQQRSSYFPLVYHESLLLFIFFQTEVYMIENKCSEKRETCPPFFFYINKLKICFADRPSTTHSCGNIRNA